MEMHKHRRPKAHTHHTDIKSGNEIWPKRKTRTCDMEAEDGGKADTEPGEGNARCGSSL